ncbi:DNA-directed RNA polymerase subunit beta [candidate division SR1 bacterium]|nr:DNA-directed RNA polymerase subunit beta [candidate division SR1 bacterium]
MATKKTPAKKTTPKKSSSFSTKKNVAKPVAKTAKPTPKQPITKKVEKKAELKPMIQTVSKVEVKIPDFLKDLPTVDGRIFLSDPKTYGEIPDLLELQKRGYHDLLNVYLSKLFEELNPIRDIGGNHLNITISEVKVSEPQETIEACKKKELTFGGIITAKIKLVEMVEDEKTKKLTEKILFSKRANIGTLPVMTPSATYIINGVERVLISQIVRSYGIFYSLKDFRYSCKLIPENGPWLEIDVEKTGTIVARINKSRKFPITSLFRIFGLETDEAIRAYFEQYFDEEDVNYIDITLKKDKDTHDAISAAEFIYSKLRPGEIIDPESALDYVKAQFMDPHRIHVGRIGRRKLNAKLGLSKKLDSEEANIFDLDDLLSSIIYLINLSNQKKGYYVDDSDHLANKRVRTTGEILYSHLGPVMRKFVKSVGGKLSVLNLENPIKITDLVNFKMIDTAIKSFFATSQLSQFLDQINPLGELEHKRRITALGPGGLKRETAKFDVRDVHPSHYGRICPIETPEGQNIGLITHQALYSRINTEGFLETPALKVFRTVDAKRDQLINRIADRDIFELDSKGKETKKLIVAEDEYITSSAATQIEKMYPKKAINVKPFFTGEIEYISPEMDEKTVIADATSPIDEFNNIRAKRVAARHYVDMETFHINDVTHMDVNLSQIFSPNVNVIPFVDHNDAVRASIATSQQRQAIPLLKNTSPLVATGQERNIVRMTNAVILADEDGEIIYVDGKRIKLKFKGGTKEYELTTFLKSNDKTVIVQKPMVSLGQQVKKGDLLADGPSSVGGELALGNSLRIAFMPWKGYNYEDAIVISQRLVRNDELTSMHIEKHEIEVADTKLGPEETTNDIPGISMARLSNLDENGIIRIGSIVRGGDILIGKITPKSEGDLTPEEKLIQAIFGDKSKNVKDTSLYLPSGSEGKVVDVVILDAKQGDNLMAGLKKKIKVYVATTRKIEIGDKLAGKHGNKGIIATVVPEEDMPYSADGKAVDIVLNSLGVISRMNLGQLFETQLGLIAKTLGVRFAVPTFGDFGLQQILDLADKAGMSDQLTTILYDGQTGEQFDKPVTVGYMHILKLNHMVEDKIHARSVGPYSLITQQPLGGKSRQGGQRFGEMEVWALEAYSAVYTLQEMLTVKSDDIAGRNKLYENIIKNQKPKLGGLPESFNLVTYLFRGIGQNIQQLNSDEMERIFTERMDKIKDLGLSGLITSSLDDDELISIDSLGESSDEKEEIMDKVVEELEDFGQIE